jgi:hypothetical protein
MLLASLLVACGGDDGPDDDGGGGGLDDLPAGESQLSSADRAVVSARLSALATALGTEDPVAALAIGSLGQAVVTEGWMTGVDADVASALVAGEARLPSLVATERWGVFVGDVVVLATGSPNITGQFIRGIIALRGTQTVVAYTVQDFALGQPLGGPISSGVRGLIFEGTTSVWIATAGGMQLSTAQQLFESCGGTLPAGVTCINARYTGSIGFTASTPLGSVVGNAATGSRSFSFGSSAIRGYQIEVFCEQSTLC